MPSASYEQALHATRQKHALGKTFTGRFMLRYLDDIRECVRAYSVKTVLDYGCGRGVQWSGGTLARELGVTVTKYDPGVPAWSKDPVGKFDLVICTQVLGSIPVEDLPWVIARLYGYANRCVFIGERLGPVRKRIYSDLAEEGLMPHEWTREQWKVALAGVDSKGVGVLLRTNDRRIKDSRLERVW